LAVLSFRLSPDYQLSLPSQMPQLDEFSSRVSFSRLQTSDALPPPLVPFFVATASPALVFPWSELQSFLYVFLSFLHKVLTPHDGSHLCIAL